MNVGEMTIAQLKEMLTAVENLDLRPRRPAHSIRHLDGCASLNGEGPNGFGDQCDCGMAELWMARLAVKEGL